MARAGGKKAVLLGLENLAEQLGIKIRYEKTQARGGLCRHEGKYQVIIDRKATDEFKIDVLVTALKTFDLSGIFISPQIRALLESE